MSDDEAHGLWGGRWTHHFRRLDAINVQRVLLGWMIVYRFSKATRNRSRVRRWGSWIIITSVSEDGCDKHATRQNLSSTCCSWVSLRTILPYWAVGRYLTTNQSRNTKEIILTSLARLPKSSFRHAKLVISKALQNQSCCTTSSAQTSGHSFSRGSVF